MKSRDLSYRRCMVTFLAILFIAVSIQHILYIEIAKSTVPIMDYWKWIAVYGEDVLNGDVSFLDYFKSDSGQHIQPVAMAINFGVMGASRFDVCPLVQWGAVVRIMISAALVALFVSRFWNSENKNHGVFFSCGAVIILSALNYNQWELTTQPFSLASAYRVGVYLASFYFADVFLQRIETRSSRKNILLGSLLGVFCAYLTIFVGAAYFVGHLVAIGLVMLWTLVNHRDKWREYFWPMTAWGMISLISACIYFAIYQSRSSASKAIEITYNFLVLLLEGICFFWGGLFVPEQAISEFGGPLVSMVGAFVLVYTICILLRYLRMHRNGSNMFPAICTIYALLISAVISIGRVPIFGASTMVSSRYTVESSIGLCGVAWMTYGVYSAQPVRRLNWVKPIACMSLCIMMLLASAKTETGIAPYRKIYNENLHEMMLNIEDYSDEELAPFQANSPDDVRYCVDFFRENNLSIFADTDPHAK